VDDLQRRWRKDLSLQEGARKALRLSTAAFALIHEVAAPSDLSALLSALKCCRVKLDRPRPIDEAISSAGGVAWDELNEELMLRKYPGIFCAGEMIDWDAPTGGYLLQGCFVTGTMAGEGAANWIAQNSEA
jgi:predicted flavoprotein YhiN